MGFGNHVSMKPLSLRGLGFVASRIAVLGWMALGTSVRSAVLDGEVRSIAPLPDGRVLVAGIFSNVDGGSHRRLVRLRQDLTVDVDFTPDSLLSASGVAVSQIVLLPGGGLYLRGTFPSTPNPQEGIRRFLPNGAEDLDAVPVIGGPGSGSIVNAALADGSGRTLLAGSFYRGDGISPTTSPIARVLQDGSRDPVFAAGVWAGRFSTGDRSMALRRDGKIVFVGMFRSSSMQTNANGIIRCNPDGTLDDTFLTGIGFQRAASGSGVGNCNAVAIDALGRSIVAGTFTLFGTNQVSGWARLESDGSFDPTFAPTFSGANVTQIEVLETGGILARTAAGNLEFLHEMGAVIRTLATNATALAVESSGHILVSIKRPDSQSEIVRLDPLSPVSAWVEFPLGHQVASESASGVAIRIRRAGSLEGAATVVCRVRAGTAQPGVDFQEGDVEVRFAPGVVERQMDLPLTAGNGIPGDDRTLVLELAEASGAAATPGKSQMTLVLEDDDTGLNAEVFLRANSVFANPVSLAQTMPFFEIGPERHRDAMVHFEWHVTTARGGWRPDVNGVRTNDFFSIIWTGFIVPEVTGEYRLATFADDGARLWLDDGLVIDNWRDNPAVLSVSKPQRLEAGRPHRVALHYFEGRSFAICRLQWSLPGSTNWITIPKSALRPGLPRGVAPSFEIAPRGSDPSGSFQVSCLAEPGRPVFVQTSTNGVDWTFAQEVVTAGLGIPTTFLITPTSDGTRMQAGGMVRVLSIDGLAATSQAPLPLVAGVAASRPVLALGNTNTIILTGIGNGGASQTFVWLKNGVEVASGPRLALSGVDAEAPGDYQVRLTSPAGVALSHPRTIAAAGQRILSNTVRFGSAQKLEFQAESPAGFRFAVRYSDDLVVWKDLQIVTPTVGKTLITDNTPAATARYYTLEWR